MAEERTTVIKAKYLEGPLIKIETSQTGEQKVAAKPFDLKQVTSSIESIVDAVQASLAKAKAKKTAVEFGVEIGVESGQLTALIVKGSAKANLKITLEWS